MSRSSSSWRVFQITEWKAIDPEINASNCKWFYEGNTIEEACAAMAADTESGAYELDAAAVQATVDRYNELCAKGFDDDFGKNPTFMRAIDTPPFIVVPHEFGMGLSAIIGGLLINADNQVLKADEHTPIDACSLWATCPAASTAASTTPWTCWAFHRPRHHRRLPRRQARSGPVARERLCHRPPPPLRLPEPSPREPATLRALALLRQ